MGWKGRSCRTFRTQHLLKQFRAPLCCSNTAAKAGPLWSTHPETSTDHPQPKRWPLAQGRGKWAFTHSMRGWAPGVLAKSGAGTAGAGEGENGEVWAGREMAMLSFTLGWLHPQTRAAGQLPAPPSAGSSGGGRPDCTAREDLAANPASPGFRLSGGGRSFHSRTGD